MRRWLGFLCVAVVLALGAGRPAAGGVFSVRIDGKILRKASGRLVLSLSAFELDGRREVVLTRRKTGETRVASVSTAYSDSCYTEELPADLFESIAVEEWVPSVTWVLPDTPAALNDRLHAIHEQQNALRQALGEALLEEGGAGKVSSRLDINKIEKYHRIASVIAARIRELSRAKEDYNPFRYPITIRSGFNPFARPSAAYSGNPRQQAREVLYWEVYRVLTSQLGVEEDLVDFVYDAPSTTRLVAPPAENGADFAPTVILSAESIDAAVYLARQGFGPHLKKLVRLRMYGDPFIRDRPVLDAFVNEGRVAGVARRRAAVTFVPPFARAGETMYVTLDEVSGDVVPVVLAEPRPDEGYTWTAELPDEVAARLRPGLPVRRRP